MTWKTIHAGCAARSAAFKAERDAHDARLAAGEYIRCAASQMGEAVRVMFDNFERKSICFEMSPEAYDAIPFGVAASPADYEKFGTLTAAPANFHDPMPMPMSEAA